MKLKGSSFCEWKQFVCLQPVMLKGDSVQSVSVSASVIFYVYFIVIKNYETIITLCSGGNCVQMKSLMKCCKCD